MDSSASTTISTSPNPPQPRHLDAGSTIGENVAPVLGEAVSRADPAMASADGSCSLEKHEDPLVKVNETHETVKKAANDPPEIEVLPANSLILSVEEALEEPTRGTRTRVVATTSILDETVIKSVYFDPLSFLKRQRRQSRKQQQTINSKKRPLYFQVEAVPDNETQQAVSDNNNNNNNETPSPLFWNDDDASLSSREDEQDQENSDHDHSDSDQNREDPPSSWWTVHVQPLPLALHTHVFHQYPSSHWDPSVILNVLPSQSSSLGALLHLPLPPSTGEPETSFWKFHLLDNPQSDLWKRIQVDIVKTQWSLREWFAQPFDSTEDIQQSVKVVSQLRDKFIKSHTQTPTQSTPNHHVQFAKQALPLMQDYFYWNHSTGRVPLKEFAKLRRILSPMTILVTNQNYHCPILFCEMAPYSLADLLLDSQLNNRILNKTQMECLTCLIRILVALSKYNLSDTATTEQLIRYTEIQQLILHTCQRAAVAAGGWIRLQIDEQICSVHTKFSLVDVAHLRKFSLQTRRVYSTERVAEFSKIHQSRMEMQMVYRGRQRQALLQMSPKKRKLQQQQQSPASSFSPSKRQVVTQSKMSEVDFLRKTSFMHRVNASFARPFDMGSSRPRFAELPLSSEQLRELHDMFFDSATGQLRADVAQRDASSTSQNHYISFSNDSMAGSRDKRWQIPIRPHVGKVNQVTSRALVEERLAEWGIIDPSVEIVEELGILIGGTEDQSLHHDLPRDWVTWRQRKSKHADTSCETVGWESNRLGYNEAMRSPLSPSAMLIPMRLSSQGKTLDEQCDGQLLVGVQKDQAIVLDEYNHHRRSNGKRYCRIRQGVPTQRFEIVRENKYMYVLRVHKGCRFTGDFPHAGVCNVDEASTDMTELRGFFERVDGIWERHLASSGGGDPLYHLNFTKDVLNICAATPRLDRFCRLYVSTKNKEHVLQIPENTVGYYKCYSNGPGPTKSSVAAVDDANTSESS